MSNVHSVVYSLDPSTRIIANLNREVLNLDDDLSYTVAEYIEDRASDGIVVVSVEGNSYRFSDGATEILVQQIEVAHA